MNYTEDKLFDRKKFEQKALGKGEYENCVFRQCDFSGTNLSEIKFSNSEFIGSNLFWLF
ncbi:MAG: pentapeptide repeat-containing protein [Bacteroidetes bacterium]|jgi:fluoroquinolone resistance protein|nr:pentapeptide repeat-containing protein [Bacteroidota bacterium]